jgi:hypothetical protein
MPGNSVLLNVIASESNDRRGDLDELSPNVLDNCEHSTKRFSLYVIETGRCTALMLQQVLQIEANTPGIRDELGY